MADPRFKKLKIQTGVVKRLAKEKVSYEKEADIQRGKIEKYKQEEKDEAYIKKQEEVLQESVSMISDCQRRLRKGVEDLQIILDGEQDLKETEEYAKALEALEEAKPHLPLNV